MAKEEGNTKNHNRIFILNLCISVISALCYAVVSLLLSDQITVSLVLIRILFSCILGGLTVLVFELSDGANRLFSWNRSHFIRFVLIAQAALFFSLAYLKLPVLAVPFSLFAIMLVLYSDAFTGFMTYALILSAFAFCCHDRTDGFLIPVLLLCGCAGAILFSNTRRSFRYLGSLLLYLVIRFLIFGIYALFGKLSFSAGEILLQLGIGCFSALIILIVWFSIFAKSNLYLHDDVYAQINDTEHELLTKLKSIDEAAYFHAIHTAYLAEKCAFRIDCDMPLTKAGGYYHRIGLLQGKDTLQNALLVCSAQHFPGELIELLKEYGTKSAKHISREAAIVQICDAMVSSVSFLYSKNRETPLDYGKIIDVIIRKKTENGDWNKCDLNFRELNEIKKVLTGEKQYYEFLR